MRFGVIYHSKWGNCGRVAKAIAAGLSGAENNAYVTDIGSITELDPETDCLVLGSPTSTTRATRQMRRFIVRRVSEEFRGKGFAAFGTGLEEELSNPQSADEIYRMLIMKGLKPLAPPFKVAVAGIRGPLLNGELEKALQFGRELAQMAPFDVRPITRNAYRRAS